MKPMEGLRVIDLTRFLAGPHCTMLLAGLGAEVLKIEPPGRGDMFRNRPPYGRTDGCSDEKRDESDLGLGLLHRARNKKSITLDLRLPEGKKLFADLCAKTDVVVENYAPGVMEKMGFSYDALRALNPRLVLCSISGFGNTGPLRDRRAYDPIIQAMSGLMSLTGFAGQPPVRTGAAIADTATPMIAVIGVLSALMRRQSTGCGDWVDVSMLDSLTFLMPEVIEYFQGGAITTPMENRHPGGAPFNSFHAADGYVYVATVTDDDWNNLLRAIGRDDLLDDPRYARLPDRHKCVDEVESLVEGWVKIRSRDEIVDILQSHKVACGPVLSMDEALASEQLRARDMLIPLSRPDGEEVPGAVGVGIPIRFAEDPVQFDAPAPVLGQHNDDVYGSLLGLDAAEISRLKDAGVI
ncbi:MAG: CoA transferase [Rhodospirillales bacterium]|nr:CoA transferase [Rhodospirillales bacterium]